MHLFPIPTASVNTDCPSMTEAQVASQSPFAHGAVQSYRSLCVIVGLKSFPCLASTILGRRTFRKNFVQALGIAWHNRSLNRTRNGMPPSGFIPFGPSGVRALRICSLKPWPSDPML